MTYVPSYRHDRRSRADLSATEGDDRWSVRRFLTVLLTVSAISWAALAGIAALVVG